MSNTATLSTTWSEKGKRPVFKCKQAPKERVTGLGGMNPLTGQFTVNFAGCGNAETFKGHLRKVLRCNKDKKRIIVYADNVRFHHARRPKPFLAAHPEPELRFPPAYSPDLNPVERVWWHMRKSITHNKQIPSVTKGTNRNVLEAYVRLSCD